MSELTTRKRRADAERSVAAILDAAIDVLGEHPAASMAEIAAAAGVARQTVYAHYESREALLAAVAEHALARTTAAIDAVDPQRGPPVEALDRLVRSWWREIERYARALDALAAAFPSPESVHRFHAPLLDRIEALVRRGQRAGDFDPDLPADWISTAFLALTHAAAAQVARGGIDLETARRSLQRTAPRLFGVRSEPD